MAMHKPLTLVEKPNPKVVRATCCNLQPGLVVKIEDTWVLLRDKMIKPGHLDSEAFKITMCRGCFQDLTDKTPTAPWVWGRDVQVDDHFRQMAREFAVAEAPKAGDQL